MPNSQILNYMQQSVDPLNSAVMDQRRMDKQNQYLDARQSMAATESSIASTEMQRMKNDATRDTREVLEEFAGNLNTPAAMKALSSVNPTKMMALEKHFADMSKIEADKQYEMLSANIAQSLATEKDPQKRLKLVAMTGKIKDVVDMNQNQADAKQQKIENRFAQQRINISKQTSSGGNTERMRKIQGLVDRGLSPNDASDLVEGRVSMTTPNSLGEVFLVNKTDGTKKKVVGASQAQDIGQAPVEQRTGPLMVDAAREGTGPMSALQQGISNLFGFLAEGQLFKENTASRQRLNLFNKEAAISLVQNPRFPVAEQAYVKSLLPSTEQIFKDPDDAVSNLVELKNHLESRIEANSRSISSGQITDKRRGELADQNDAMNRTLQLMGDTSPGGSLGLAGKVADGSATDEEIEEYLRLRGQ